MQVTLSGGPQGGETIDWPMTGVVDEIVPSNGLTWEHYALAGGVYRKQYNSDLAVFVGEQMPEGANAVKAAE